MAADEWRYHVRRGLPRWERLGHPLDTLTVILCLTWILFIPPTRRSAVVWVVLAVFSSVFVTKDEPVHWLRCSAGEQWLHSLLFTLHPITLACAALMWPAAHSSSPPVLMHFLRFTGFERAFLTFVCVLMIGFGLYQLVFWNLIWRPEKNAP